MHLIKLGLTNYHHFQLDIYIDIIGYSMRWVYTIIENHSAIPFHDSSRMLIVRVNAISGKRAKKNTNSIQFNQREIIACYKRELRGSLNHKILLVSSRRKQKCANWWCRRFTPQVDTHVVRQVYMLSSAAHASISWVCVRAVWVGHDADTKSPSPHVIEKPHITTTNIVYFVYHRFPWCARPLY